MKSIFTLCFLVLVQIFQIKGQCWKQVSMGRDHCLAIHTDGSLWAWGNNTYGESGDGTRWASRKPVKVGKDTDWKQVSAGEYFSLAVKADGTLWAWGRNSFGVLGDGSSTDWYTPKRIGTETNWKQVSAHINQSGAIKNDGTVWLWGRNYLGQLGDGTFKDSSIPKQLVGINNCVQVSAGNGFYNLLLSDGSLWSIGSNQYGQLGDSTIINKKLPSKVGTSNQWTFVSSGGNHTLALQQDGSLWAWGWGSDGQIGNGSLLNQLKPQQITTTKDWKTLYAGFNHSVAIKKDGSLWTWGSNLHGKLGDSTTVSKNIPTKIGNENSWLEIGGGTDNTTLALKNDGTASGWGYNFNGAIGDGTLKNKNYPVSIICPPSNYQSSIWEKQNVNLPLNARGWEIKQVNENVVWFYAQGGFPGIEVSAVFEQNFTNYTFARTTNGGETWNTGVFPFNGKKGDLTHMAAIDDTTAWVTYVESVTGNFDTYTSKAYKTTDGGKTWVLANISIGANWVNCIHFFNKNEGVIMADATTTDFNIFTTSNGGISWTKVNNTTIPDLIKGSEYGVNFLTTVGDKIWFPTWEGRIFYSPDKGKNWDAFDGPSGAIGLIMQISSDDTGNLYVDEVDTDNRKHRFLRRNISDGSWTNLTGNSNAGFIFFDCIPGTQNIIMCNSLDNKTRISRDKGQSWIVIDSIDTFSKYFINFINSKSGFCANRETLEGTKRVLKYAGSPLSGLLSQQVLNIDLKLYPNPAVENVTLKFDTPKKDHFWILVHDVTGNLMYKKSIREEGTYSQNIDISAFTSGTYFLTVSNQDGLKSLTFVKL